MSNVLFRKKILFWAILHFISKLLENMTDDAWICLVNTQFWQYDRYLAVISNRMNKYIYHSGAVL
jgi:uncharacterized protein with von Willebrand factor type A (vWA) domain